MAVSPTPTPSPLATNLLLVYMCLTDMTTASENIDVFPLQWVFSNNEERNSKLHLSSYFIYKVPSHLFPHLSFITI